MKQHRFYLQGQLKPGQITIEDPDFCHQITKVLRFKPGQVLVIFNQDGWEAEAVIDYLSAHKIQVSLRDLRRPEHEPALESFLYCAVLKKENFALVVQKSTEIGIKNIIPLITEHTVKQNINLNRLGAIAREASEQSGRVTLPVIQPALSWEEALSHASNNGANYFFSYGSNC